MMTEHFAADEYLRITGADGPMSRLALANLTALSPPAIPGVSSSSRKLTFTFGSRVLRHFLSICAQTNVSASVPAERKRNILARRLQQTLQRLSRTNRLFLSLPMRIPVRHTLTIALCLSVALTRDVSGQNISQISTATGPSGASPFSLLPEDGAPATSSKGVCPATFFGDQRPVSWKKLAPNLL